MEEEKKPTFERTVIRAKTAEAKVQEEKTEQAKRDRRNKWSIYHFMINMNKPFTSTDEPGYLELRVNTSKKLYC